MRVWDTEDNACTTVHIGTFLVDWPVQERSGSGCGQGRVNGPGF